MLFIRHYFAYVFSALILFSISEYSSAENTHKGDLIDRISQTKKQMNALQLKVSKESAELQQHLVGLELTLKKLRTEAKNVQRTKDENLLSYEQLKDRVDKWSTQSKYQNHLLTNYLSMIGDSKTLAKVPESDEFLYVSIIDIALQRVGSKLSPTWENENVINVDGRIELMARTAVGPIEIAYDDKSGKAGFVDRDQLEQPRIKSIFSEEGASDIALIKSNGNGMLFFDPSLGNAFKLQKRETNLLQLFQAGGLWAVPIVFFGFLAFVIAIIKGVQLIRLPQIDMALADNLINLFSEPDATSSRSALSLRDSIDRLVGDVGAAQKKLVNIALTTPVSAQRDDLLVAHLMEIKYKIERFMGVVATVAAVSPLLGLLGTVSGMISTFKMMTIFGSGDPSTVSGGISEALITTELGLVVAIPSLLVSALLVRKSKTHAHQLETFAIKLSKIEFQCKNA